MEYNPRLRTIDNLDILFKEQQKTKNSLYTFNSQLNDKHIDSIDGLLDLAEVSSDDTDATTELAGLITELYDAVAELGNALATITK